MTDLSIADIQQDVLDLHQQRNWEDKSLEARAIYLAREAREVREAIVKLGWGSNPERLAQLGAEIYDVLWNAVDLARLAGVDLDQVARDKREHNQTRKWA